MDSSVDDSPDEVYWALAAAEAEPTLRETLSGPDGAEWQAAVDYEIGQLEKLSVWKIVDYPLHTNIILCHFILATKHRPDSKKLKLQACLVANEQRQKHGLDYSETFMPTTNMTTICTILAIAAHHNWEIHQIDIKALTSMWNSRTPSICEHHQDISKCNMKERYCCYCAAFTASSKLVLSGQRS
jgi:hypothetical protein